MKGLVVLLFVGLVALSLASCIGSRRPALPDAMRAIQLSGPPCGEGLITVEAQAEIPLRLTIAKATCASPQEARVQFVAENIGTATISKLEIRGLGTYDRAISGRKGVDTISGALEPNHTTTGIVGIDIFSDRRAILTSYTLTVWSITYADGKTWNHAPLRQQS